MDFVTDRSSRHLARLNTLLEVPDYVKEASVDADSLSSVPDHLFANSARREFPIDTAGHTYLSYAYGLSAGAPDHVMTEIKSAAATFAGLNDDLAKVAAAIEAANAPAVVPQKFAVYVDFGDEGATAKQAGVKVLGVQGFYPINDAEQIRESSVNIGNDRQKLPLGLFVDGCTELCKAASEKGIFQELPRTVQFYGIPREIEMDFVKQQAFNRASATGDNTYLELAEAIAEDPTPSTGDWVELWSDLDAQHCIKYAKHTLDPFQILNSGEPISHVEKELSQWTLLKGAAVPTKVLTSLTAEQIQKGMSKEAAATVTVLLANTDGIDGAELTNRLAELDPAIQTALLRVSAK